MSPVNANSIARWCGMRRGKRNRPPPMATTPLRTSGRPSLALDAATMRSQLRHNSSPPPTAYPSTAARHRLQVGASAEGAARASDDADEQAVVRIQHVHDGLHLTRGGQIERVPR